MADVIRGTGGVFCNDRCGCPSPCPGGLACRCRTSEDERSGVTGGGEGEHKKCSCGEHCGCNPCTSCSKSEMISSTTQFGRAYCKCGVGCTCVTCAS